MNTIKSIAFLLVLLISLFSATDQRLDTTPPEVPAHLADINWDQVRCLARNIFYESNGEPIAGQLAVAQVTLNRARESNQSICSVVYQKKQFSWTEKKPTKLGTPSDEAYNLAQEVLLKGYADKELETAHFFHAKSVRPEWRKKFKFIKTIGNHKFYGKETSDT